MPAANLTQFNQASFEAVLNRTVQRGPMLFKYQTTDLKGRGPVVAGHGVLECRPWRSSMELEHWAEASDGQNEWVGDGTLNIHEASARPPRLLRPLWLVGCLFGTVRVSLLDADDKPTDASVDLLVESDLEMATNATGLVLAVPPHGIKETLRVKLGGHDGDLVAIEGEAHLGRARIEFLPDRVDAGQIHWDRIGALVGTTG